MRTPVFAIALHGLLSLTALSGSQGLRAEAPPNVLLILVDDLNDWVGFLGGHPQVKTPHLDRLAARGVVFTNAHCQAPLCNPSRTSFMLGLRPTTTGVYGLSPWFRDVSALKDRVPLPRYFAAHGYHTLATGKVFHRHFGLRDGDREFAEVGPRYDDGPFPPRRLSRVPGSWGKGNDWGPTQDRDEDRGDWKLTSWAIERLRGAVPKPFFMAVGIRLPHVPLFAPEEWFDLYPEHRVTLPERRRDDRNDTPRFSWYLHWRLPEHRLIQLDLAGENRHQVRAYLACVSFMDAQVGRLMETLEQTGLSRNTIVVVASDHGWHLGEKEITGKNTLWEPSTRVPFLFAGPGIGRRLQCREPVELLDLYPTLVELCGLPRRPELEGLSLLPQLQDPAHPRPRPALTTANPGNHALRSQEWRYIRYADGSEELYHLETDPHEWTNLATTGLYQDVLAQHRRWLPRNEADFAPGSRGRTLEVRHGQVFWEGALIKPDAPIPGF